MVDLKILVAVLVDYRKLHMVMCGCIFHKNSLMTLEHPLTHIRELQPGDELICYMRLGLALERAVKGNGSPYRKVPRKTQRARSTALTRFTGIVLNNNTVAGVLTVQTTRMDSMKIAVGDLVEPSLSADIHYTAFQRVQRLSKFSSPGRTNSYPSRPTSTEGLGTQPKAFRTLEEIVIV